MKRPKIDLTGKRFGRLVALKDVGRSKSGNAVWLCKCDCGNRIKVTSGSLGRKKRPTHSCGCLQKEVARKQSTVHGQWGTRLYKIWDHMIGRCYRPNEAGYERYGGRGIKVCNEWRTFKPFYEWAVSHGYADDLEIDRLDNDKGYYPDNCQWASEWWQANHTSRNVLIEVDGKKYPLGVLARKYGIKRITLYSRYKKGWPIDKLLAPVERKG